MRPLPGDPGPVPDRSSPMEAAATALTECFPWQRRFSAAKCFALFMWHCTALTNQEPVEKKKVQEKPLEVAEVTANKYSFNPEFHGCSEEKMLQAFGTLYESDSLEPGKRGMGMDLRTHYTCGSVKVPPSSHELTLNLENCLQSNVRCHHTLVTKCNNNVITINKSCILTEEAHMRKWGKKEKKRTLYSFSPVYTSVWIPSAPGAKKMENWNRF
ncbi:uncharacterized protein LOC127478990 [Manacus candei]|uniref:uncharacterized protein LOC127478990 n=1 Tax=Manacus candei TaxID=415023 RepID=UPI002226E416|nr:uncharacterized protein LOC127478990 [Manacus candei]